MQPKLQPVSAPMGFISDVHGNLAALEAVLVELDHKGVGQVYVAGDLLLGGDRPLDVWRQLRAIDACCIRGISDTALCSVDPASLEPQTTQEADRAAQFQETRAALGDLVIEQVRRLPEQKRIPMIDGREIVMVHGSPVDPTQEISHDLDEEEVLSLVGDDPADIVVCGATHVPFQRRVHELHIVNVGSVGQAPEGRVAHFTVLTPRMEGATIAQDFVVF